MEAPLQNLKDSLSQMDTDQLELLIRQANREYAKRTQKNSRMILSEYLTKEGGKTAKYIEYQVIRSHKYPPHVFVGILCEPLPVSVPCEGVYLSTGGGATKKDAEEDAAKNALIKLGYLPETSEKTDTERSDLQMLKKLEDQLDDIYAINGFERWEYLQNNILEFPFYYLIKMPEGIHRDEYLAVSGGHDAIITRISLLNIAIKTLTLWEYA